MQASVMTGEHPEVRNQEGGVPRLRPGERRALGLKLLRRRLTERLAFDSVLFQRAAGLFGSLAAWLLRVAGRPRRGFRLLSTLHRANWSGLASAGAERLAREAAAQAARGGEHALLALYREHVEQLAPSPRTARFFENPGKLLGPMVMVLKTPAAGEKGALLLQYSYTFPLFARRFDLAAIASRYYIVLEPDWSGYCDPNILSYCRYPFPVFVQAFEPRDAEFIAGLRSNLVVVPTSTNWWVDHRLFRPLPGAVKDVDLVMVAGWGWYKRHFRFFSALGRLRKEGHRPRVLLLGYPIDFSKEEVLRQAAYHGVADQLEVHEWVPYEQVNEFVNRAKVNVIWSRKEGVNRAIIEGMFAGVPCVVREGFNYGYRYPYINPQTGCFASERDLPERLLEMIRRHHEFSPREWVAAHMSCQRATEILAGVIGQEAAARGEPWTGNLAVKVNKLHGMEYWDPEAGARFEADYAFLRSALRA